MTFTSTVNAADKHKKNKQTLKLVGEVYDSFTMGKVDAEMRRPVDVDIIHDGCREVTDYIMKVCEMFELYKPRTNYKHARQAYLQLVKKAKKKGRMVRETIGVMQKYLLLI